MADRPTVELRGGPSYIRFEVSPPRAGVDDYMPTAIILDTGIFRGSFATSTWTGEWLALCEALAGIYHQVGQDTEARTGFSDEARINLTFKLVRLGHLDLLVEIRLHEQDTELRFWISADQTFLPLWLQAINVALAQLCTP